MYLKLKLGKISGGRCDGKTRRDLNEENPIEEFGTVDFRSLSFVVTLLLYTNVT